SSSAPTATSAIRVCSGWDRAAPLPTTVARTTRRSIGVERWSGARVSRRPPAGVAAAPGRSCAWLARHDGLGLDARRLLGRGLLVLRAVGEQCPVGRLEVGAHEPVELLQLLGLLDHEVLGD